MRIKKLRGRKGLYAMVSQGSKEIAFNEQLEDAKKKFPHAVEYLRAFLKERNLSFGYALIQMDTGMKPILDFWKEAGFSYAEAQYKALQPKVVMEVTLLALEKMQNIMNTKAALAVPKVVKLTPSLDHIKDWDLMRKVV